MPQTIEKNSQDQIIAGVFSDPKNADKATVAFQKMGVPPEDIQILIQPDKKSLRQGLHDRFAGAGFR